MRLLEQQIPHQPQEVYFDPEIFSEKIGGIVVGDRSEVERGHAVVEKGVVTRWLKRDGSVKSLWI
jgi:hypothetical protein